MRPVSPDRSEETVWENRSACILLSIPVHLHISCCPQPNLCSLRPTAWTMSMQQLWEGWDPATSQIEFSSWLPTFFDEVLTIIGAELKWAASHLPEQFPAVVLHLLTAFFSRISKSFRSRMEAALASGESLCSHSAKQTFSACTPSTDSRIECHSLRFLKISRSDLASTVNLTQQCTIKNAAHRIL